MEDVMNQSLKKIAKGSGIAFIGTVLAQGFGFLTTILIVRSVTQTQYGLYSIGLSILGMMATLAAFGLPIGSARYIAYYRARKDEKMIRKVISSSFFITVTISIFLSVVTFLIADLISINFFHNQELSQIIQIFSLAIPFSVSISILASIFSGFDRANEKTYFQNILGSFSFLVFLGIVISLSLSFFYVLVAYLASLVITWIAFIIYFLKNIPVKLWIKDSSSADPITIELFLFSSPIFFQIMLNKIISWTAIMFLGYFKTPDIVGIYSGSFFLSSALLIVHSSVVFIYIPIISTLYSKGFTEELRRSYESITKWIFSVIFSFIVILLLFPNTVLGLLLGSQYEQGATTLQILALSCLIHVFFGPNGATLTAIGKTKILMWASLIGSVLSIILSFLLIPSMGIIGAAVAFIFARGSINVIVSAKLYFVSKIHPFTQNYLKPIILSSILMILPYLLINSIFTPYWALFLFFLSFVIIYGSSLVLTRSLDDNDIKLLLAIEERLGVNLGIIKKILNKFIA